MQRMTTECPLCHQAIPEADMRNHDCQHEYVYAHGQGFIAAKIHEATVAALMKRHKVTRNDKCFCHSGLKFKKCCGAPRTAAQLQELINERLEKLPRRVSNVGLNLSN